MENSIHIIKNNGFKLKLYHSHALPRCKNYRNHFHTEFEISLIKQGSGLYQCGNKSYDILEGDMFLFSTNEHHCITDIFGESGMIIMNLHFDPAFIYASGNEMDLSFLRIFFDRSGNFQNRLDRDNPVSADIRTLLLDIENEFNTKNDGFDLMIKVKVLTILALLIRSYGYVNPASTNFVLVNNLAHQINKAIKFMEDKLCSDISLNDIAQSANMSCNYFLTVFKKLNGITPWNYLLIKRIEYAKNIIKVNKDINILDVALRSGFNNSSNFNKAFKKIVGTTPKLYRKYLEIGNL